MYVCVCVCVCVCLCVCVVQEFLFAKSMDGSNVEAIQEFMEESIRGVCGWVNIHCMCVIYTCTMD